jgi:hypothetical protein
MTIMRCAAGIAVLPCEQQPICCTKRPDRLAEHTGIVFLRRQEQEKVSWLVSSLDMLSSNRDIPSFHVPDDGLRR